MRSPPCLGILNNSSSNFSDCAPHVSVDLSLPAQLHLNPLWWAENTFNLPANCCLDIFTPSCLCLSLYPSLSLSPILPPLSIHLFFVCQKYSYSIFRKKGLKKKNMTKEETGIFFCFFFFLLTKTTSWVTGGRQSGDRRLYMNHRFIRTLIEIGSGGHRVNVAGKRRPHNNDW